MKYFEKFLYGLLGAALLFAGTALATNISVPQATGNGYMLISTSSGAYIPSSTINATTANFSTVNATSTATSTLANANTVLWVPPDFATNGCADDPTKTEFGACFNALVTKAHNFGYSAAEVHIPNIKVTAAQWTTAINPNISGFVYSMDCVRGAVLIYGGIGTSTIFNMSNPTGHTVSNNYGCSMQGNNTRIAAAQTNSKTTVGLGIGGNLGAVGVNFSDWDVNGFGQNIHIGANAYMLSFHNVSDSGGNGGVLGDLLYIDVANNSGERNVWDGGSLTDPGNSIEDNAIYISNGATASNFFSNLSIDDAQVYCGSSDGMCSFDKIHVENAAYATYGRYIAFLGKSSDRSTQFSLTNSLIANDTSGPNSIHTIINMGGPTYVTNINIQNYGGGTISNLVDHSLDNGVSGDHICQIQVQSGALTNIVAGSGGVAYTRATGATCVDNVDNSYTIGMRPMASNANEFFSGGITTATFDHSGNWTFLNNGSFGGTFGVTGKTTLSNASSTLFSSNYASSTLGNFGTLTIPNLGTAAGTFLAADASGNVIATTSPITGASFGQSWELNSAGQLAPTTTVPILVASPSTSTIANLGGVLDVSQCSGANIGAQFNTCYGLLPATGGTINFPRGNFSFNTEMVAATNNKHVAIVCDPGGGTRLTWTTTTGTSTLINTGQNTFGQLSSISNCIFIGAGTTTPNVAIELGGSNGARGASLNNLEIENFGNSGAVQTNSNAYMLSFNNDQVHLNGKAFYPMSSSNAGEQVNFLNGMWGDCNSANLPCVDTGTGLDTFYFNGTSFDGGQVKIGANTRSVIFSGNNIESSGGDNWPTYVPVVIAASAGTHVTMDGVTFLQGANANCPAQSIQNGAYLTINSMTVDQYGGCVVANVITNTGNGWTKVFSVNKKNSAYTDIYNSTSGTGLLSYDMEDNGFLGLNTEATLGQFELYQQADSNANGIALLNHAGTGSLRLWEDTAQNTRLDGDSSQAKNVVFNGSGTGKIGIGTTSPFARLDILSTLNNQTPLLNIASSTLGLSTTSALFISANGNVSLGTTTAAFALSVVPNINAGNGVNGLQLVNTLSSGSSGGTGTFYQTATVPANKDDRLGFLAGGYWSGSANTNATLIGFFADQTWTIGANQGSYIRFETTANNTTTRTERMRITNAGNIGIGTTTPYANLSIDSGSSTGDAFAISTSTTHAVFGIDNDGHSWTSGPAPVISACGTGTGTVVGDDQSGTITTATAATACTMTFSKAYRKTPTCTVTDNSLVGFADISSVSTSAVTFGISSALTGGLLYYDCRYHQ